jgi:hypothetical protein
MKTGRILMSRSCSNGNAGQSSVQPGCSRSGMNLEAYTKFSPQILHSWVLTGDLLAGFIPQPTAF